MEKEVQVKLEKGKIQLAEPTDEALKTLRGLSPVCEVGAGRGHWVKEMRNAGVDCVGFDIARKNRYVRKGDHLRAAESHARTMLMVWPPDGTETQDWIRAWPGEYVAIVGNLDRIDLGDMLNDWTKVDTIRMKAGPKGLNTLHVWRRPDADSSETS